MAFELAAQEKPSASTRVEPQLRISEIFYSLQGEAATVGIPTVFIRLSGCPLRCVYCDTAYAFHGGEVRNMQEILTEVKRHPSRYITVTGGEPLAQKNCLKLLEDLVDEGYEVSLETSGAMNIRKIDDRVSIVMDLKTPSSGEQHRNKYENIQYLSRKDQIKFVIAGREDYIWAKQQLEKYALTEKCLVLFSPVADQQNPTELADAILQDGLAVRFQMQLHKYLWGDVAGR